MAVSSSTRSNGWRSAVCAIVLSCSGAALAEGWNGVIPGVTTREALIERFGEPSRVVTTKGVEVLAYFRTQALPGTQQVQFRLDPQQRVSRVDVFPASRIDKATIVNTYGSACGSRAASANCYEEKLLGGTRVYYHFASLGLAVFFEADQTVQSLVYRAAQPGGKPKQDPPGIAQSPPGTGAQPGPPEQPDRGHREQEMFEAEASATESGGGGDDRRSVEDSLFDSTRLDGSWASTESLEADTLAVGGQLYVRGEGNVNRRSAGVLSAPHVNARTLLEAYLDGRPNERIRGMIVGRVYYDPFWHKHASLEHLGISEDPPNPNYVLDQMWLKFDFGRTAFLTLGKQHLKWGVGRLWNPTDLMSPEVRDPLAVYDERLGSPMVKLHVPWESMGWNFYGVGLIQNLEFVWALRAEMLLGSAELATSVVFEAHRQPAGALSLSMPLFWVFDLYGEVAVNHQQDLVLWRRVSGQSPEAGWERSFEPFRPPGMTYAASGGLQATFRIPRQGTINIGAEYFHNPQGYDDPALYWWLDSQQVYRGFYVGKRYAALFATVEAPGSWDNTAVTFSTSSNLADSTYLSRLDVRTALHDRMILELFGQYHYGRRGGEFKFSLELPRGTLYGADFPAVSVPPSIFTVGFGMRIRI